MCFQASTKKKYIYSNLALQQDIAIVLRHCNGIKSPLKSFSLQLITETQKGTSGICMQRESDTAV